MRNNLKSIFLFSLIYSLNIFCQIIPDEQAPEIWSKPKEISSIPYEEYYGDLIPSVTADGNLLIINGYKYIEKTDRGWSGLKKTEIPYQGIDNSTISFNGTRLYFRIFNRGWDLYYADWNRENNTWGDLTNCGPGVNDPSEDENFAYQLNDTTLLILRGSVTYISFWNKSENIWGEASEYPALYYEFASGWGIAADKGLEKIYTVHLRETKDSNNYQWLHEDMFVSYKDSLNPARYSKMYRLNLCYRSDSLFHEGSYKSNWEQYPTITQDGKKLFFIADYEGIYKIYESDLLIDKNGIPVGVKNKNSNAILQKFKLYPPFPNPFNSHLNIKYNIYEDGYGLITLSNILGQEIKNIGPRWFNKGIHRTTFSANNLSTGIYILNFSFEGFSNHYKTILLK